MGEFSIRPGREGSIAAVHPQVEAILREAANRLPAGWKVEAFSGVAKRSTGTGNHPSGRAIDVSITDPNGRVIDNYLGSPYGKKSQAQLDAWKTYEGFAHVTREVQHELYPSLDNQWRWGGYFKSAPNPGDSMHFDLSGGLSARTPPQTEFWASGSREGVLAGVSEGPASTRSLIASAPPGPPEAIGYALDAQGPSALDPSLGTPPQLASAPVEAPAARGVARASSAPSSDAARDAAIKTAYWEDQQHPDAVLSVIYNRTQDKRYSSDALKVVGRGEFNAFGTKKYTNSHVPQSEYDRLGAMWDGMQAGTVEPVTPATHFLNPSIAKHQSWQDTMTPQGQIGDQLYYGEVQPRAGAAAPEVQQAGPGALTPGVAEATGVTRGMQVDAPAEPAAPAPEAGGKTMLYLPGLAGVEGKNADELKRQAADIAHAKGYDNVLIGPPGEDSIGQRAWLKENYQPGFGVMGFSRGAANVVRSIPGLPGITDADISVYGSPYDTAAFEKAHPGADVQTGPDHLGLLRSIAEKTVPVDPAPAVPEAAAAAGLPSYLGGHGVPPAEAPAPRGAGNTWADVAGAPPVEAPPNPYTSAGGPTRPGSEYAVTGAAGMSGVRDHAIVEALKDHDLGLAAKIAQADPGGSIDALNKSDPLFQSHVLSVLNRSAPPPLPAGFRMPAETAPGDIPDTVMPTPVARPFNVSIPAASDLGPSPDAAPLLPTARPTMLTAAPPAKDPGAPPAAPAAVPLPVPRPVAPVAPEAAAAAPAGPMAPEARAALDNIAKGFARRDWNNLGKGYADLNTYLQKAIGPGTLLAAATPAGRAKAEAAATAIATPIFTELGVRAQNDPAIRSGMDEVLTEHQNWVPKDYLAGTARLLDGLKQIEGAQTAVKEAAPRVVESVKEAAASPRVAAAVEGVKSLFGIGGGDKTPAAAVKAPTFAALPKGINVTDIIGGGGHATEPTKAISVRASPTRAPSPPPKTNTGLLTASTPSLYGGGRGARDDDVSGSLVHSLAHPVSTPTPKSAASTYADKASTDLADWTQNLGAADFGGLPKSARAADAFSSFAKDTGDVTGSLPKGKDTKDLSQIAGVTVMPDQPLKEIKAATRDVPDKRTLSVSKPGSGVGTADFPGGSLSSRVNAALKALGAANIAHTPASSLGALASKGYTMPNFSAGSGGSSMAYKPGTGKTGYTDVHGNFQSTGTYVDSRGNEHSYDMG